MKRFVAILLAVLLLGGISSGATGTAGSKENPLITKNYIDATYIPQIVQQATLTVSNRLTPIFNAAVNALTTKHNEFLARIGASGSDFALSNGYVQLSVPQGGSVQLATGASAMLISGSAAVSFPSGAVIDVRSGEEVESGAQLEAVRRYFTAEDTIATVTATSASLIMVDGRYKTGGGVTVYKPRFADVAPSAWYFDAVEFVCDNGLFDGVSETSFAPNVNMNRAMIVTVLWRLEGKPAAATQPTFTDLTGDWYKQAVAWAAENKIVEGYDANTFGPNDSVTREQIATIMYRYAKYSGLVTAEVSTDRLVTFPDIANISSYAIEPMAWATSVGLINGSDGQLLPKGTATRCQVAQIMRNFCYNVLAGV